MRWSLAAFLIFPYFVWIARIPSWTVPAVGQWLPALASALGQAVLSSTAALITGWILFMSLQAHGGRRARGLAESALLLPNIIPPLFLALGLLNFTTLFFAFPYGLGAVIAAHVLLNAGLVAIALDRLVQAKLGGMAEVCWILGAKKGDFWRSIAWPYIRADLASLYLFVFSLCFTSFSLPLLLGGDRASTLEVVIYDFIRFEGHWDKAVLLAVFQAGILLALAWLLPQPFWPVRPARRGLRYLASPRARHFVFVPAVLLVAGWLAGLWQGLRGAPWPDLPFAEAVLTTLIVSLSVGLAHLVLFLLIAYVSPHDRLRRFLNGYLSPSPVITGFALLLLPGEGDGWNLLKLILALTLISLPLLYRWLVHSALAGLNGQIAVARTLGASSGVIMLEIVWPQIAAPVLRACGLAALWASGDFALTGILGGNIKTLPLLMEDLIANYRFEQAGVLLLPLVVLSLGVYLFFAAARRLATR